MLYVDAQHKKQFEMSKNISWLKPAVSEGQNWYFKSRALLKLTYWCYGDFADVVSEEWFLQNEIAIKMLRSVARPFDKNIFWYLKLSYLKEHHFHKDKLNYLMSSH